MEFDDHEDQEEEMEEEVPVTPRFDTVVAANSSLGRPTKIGPTSSGELLPSSVAQSQTTTTTNSRKSGSAGGPVRYRECLKNHAVGMGGHAVDGCGEFMAAGEEGTLDALKCAACNCHRNFHRKETATESGNTNANHNNNIQLGGGIYQPPPAHHHLPPQFSGYYPRAAPPPPISGGYLHIAPQRPLALPAVSGGAYSRDEEDVSNPSSSGGGGGGSGGGGVSGGSSKKRFRTKFTQEQKDKLLAFAERLGWRIQKHDDAAVEAFCADTGVKRQVLKVWMHNNKHTLGKKP